MASSINKMIIAALAVSQVLVHAATPTRDVIHQDLYEGAACEGNKYSIPYTVGDCLITNSGQKSAKYICVDGEPTWIQYDDTACTVQVNSAPLATCTPGAAGVMVANGYSCHPLPIDRLIQYEVSKVPCNGSDIDLDDGNSQSSVVLLLDECTKLPATEGNLAYSNKTTVSGRDVLMQAFDGTSCTGPAVSQIQGKLDECVNVTIGQVRRMLSLSGVHSTLEDKTGRRVLADSEIVGVRFRAAVPGTTLLGEDGSDEGNGDSDGDGDDSGAGGKGDQNGTNGSSGSTAALSSFVAAASALVAGLLV